MSVACASRAFSTHAIGCVPRLFTCRRALAKIDDSKKVFPTGGIDLTNGLASGGDAYREGTRGMSVDGFAKFDGSQQLAAWLDRLDAFVTALDAIDADDPYSFCEDAWDIWESAAISDPPPPATDPAMLLVLGGN